MKSRNQMLYGNPAHHLFTGIGIAALYMIILVLSLLFGISLIGLMGIC